MLTLLIDKPNIVARKSKHLRISFFGNLRFSVQTSSQKAQNSSEYLQHLLILCCLNVIVITFWRKFGILTFQVKCLTFKIKQLVLLKPRGWQAVKKTTSKLTSKYKSSFLFTMICFQLNIEFISHRVIRLRI